MIKVICDICSKEPAEKDFMFEATKLEVMTDLISGQKQQDKQIIQICKKCYDKHIKKLL